MWHPRGFRHKGKMHFIMRENGLVEGHRDLPLLQLQKPLEELESLILTVTFAGMHHVCNLAQLAPLSIVKTMHKEMIKPA